MHTTVGKKTTNRIGAGSLAFVLMFALSSCFLADPIPVSRELAVRDNGQGGIQILVCTDIEANRLLFEYRVAGEDWVAFWRYSGDGKDLEPGSVIDTIDDQRFPGVLRTPSLLPETRLSILVGNEVDGFDSLFVVPKDGLSTVDWLTVDGAMTDHPCDESSPTDRVAYPRQYVRPAISRL